MQASFVLGPIATYIAVATFGIISCALGFVLVDASTMGEFFVSYRLLVAYTMRSFISDFLQRVFGQFVGQGVMLFHWDLRVRYNGYATFRYPATTLSATIASAL